MVSHGRIAHVITQLELGGAQGSVLELLRRLDPRRYQVTLLTAPGGPLEAEARAIPHVEVVTVPSLVRPIHPWRDAGCVRELTRLIRQRRFDIVHTHSSKAGVLGRWAAHRAGVPVICHTIHGFAFHPYQPRWLNRAYQMIERQTARITTHLINVSRHDERTALSVGIGTSSQHRYIPYGIDVQRFHRNGLAPESVRARLGLRPDAPTIGTIACFKPQKAPQDFLEVCATLRKRIPNIQCVMVGDGRLRPLIERRRRALSLEATVHLLGWRRDIPEILTALDVLVLTSRWEGFPVAVLEAQAMGVPVVATDTGGVRDCITDGATGRLAPVGAIEEIARCVSEVLGDREQAQAMARAASASIAGRFSIDRMVQEVDALYAGALQITERGGR